MGIGIGLGGGGSSSAVASSGEIEFVDCVEAAATESNGLSYVPMSNAAIRTVQFSFVAPSTGTYDIQVYYKMSAANSGDVEVHLDYLAVAATEDPAGALTTGTEFTFAPGNDANLHVLSTATSANMSVAATAGDQVICALIRTNDAADTHTGDLRITRIRWEEV